MAEVNRTRHCGVKTMRKPKLLRVTASCVVAFTILFVIAAVSFEIFVAPFESALRMNFVVVAVLNVVEATLLFVWSDIIDGRPSPNVV